MRLDKFLSELNIGTRTQVKAYIRQGLVTVNEVTATRAEQRIDEKKDKIAFKGKELLYQPFVYYMLNKPSGVVSATQDNTCKTVLDLLASDRKKELFPVGRLDKDTEGLLLITNDGELAHKLLSPKKHVEKTYLAVIKKKLSLQETDALRQGVDIGEKNLTMPAKIKILSDTVIELTIHEGKFHQVKRMLKAVNNEVLSLKRIAFGGIRLDETLAAGAYRELTKQEIEVLQNENNV